MGPSRQDAVLVFVISSVMYFFVFDETESVTCQTGKHDGAFVENLELQYWLTTGIPDHEISTEQ